MFHCICNEICLLQPYCVRTVMFKKWLCWLKNLIMKCKNQLNLWMVYSFHALKPHRKHPTTCEDTTKCQAILSLCWQLWCIELCMAKMPVNWQTSSKLWMNVPTNNEIEKYLSKCYSLLDLWHLNDCVSIYNKGLECIYNTIL